jgi:hypothetical protein
MSLRRYDKLPCILSKVGIKYIRGVASRMSSYMEEGIDSFTKNAGLNRELNMIMNAKNTLQ